jgi:very-short-patch-repair endonuclease
MEKDKPFYFGANTKTFQKAEALRGKMTKAEKTLWQLLRRKNIDGYKFRRQHPLGQFIADFYCYKARLVIEVDGGIHLKRDQKEYDEARSIMISQFGLRIIRFTNEEVLKSPKTVLEKIDEALKDEARLPPPSPEGEGAKMP